MKNPKTFAILKSIFLSINKKNKLLALVTISFSVVSSFAAAVSISSVIPFLNIILNPDSTSSLIQKFPFAGFFPFELKSISHKELVVYAGFFFVFFVLISSIISISSSFLNSRLSAQITSNLSENSFKNFYSQPYEVITSKEKTDLINLFNLSVDYVFRIISNFITLLSNFFLGLVVFALLLLVRPGASFFILGFVLFFYVLISYVLRPRFINYSSQSIKTLREKNLITNIAFLGIRDVFLDSNQSNIINNYSLKEYEIRKLSSYTQILSQSPKPIIDFIAITSIVLLSVYSVTSTQDTPITIVTTLAFFVFASQRLLPAFQRVYASWAMIKNNSDHLVELLKFANCKSFTIAPPDSFNSVRYSNQTIGPFAANQAYTLGSFSLSNISFSYKSCPLPIISDLSLDFLPSQYNVICGPSGSGKSTLLDLITGLLHSEQGSFIVDQKCLRIGSNDHKSFVSKNIAYVSQSPLIQSGSLAENISSAYCNSYIDSSLLEKCVTLAGLDSFVSTLPRKLSTHFNFNSSELSGGQKQRIAIARALYRKRPILILDESTSALDSTTEKLVFENIFSLKTSGVCILHVTHKSSFLNRADRILRMQNGVVHVSLN